MAIRYLIRRSEEFTSFKCAELSCNRSTAKGKPFKIIERATERYFEPDFDFEVCAKMWLLRNGYDDF